MTNSSVLPLDVHLTLRAGGDTDWLPYVAYQPGAQVRVSVRGEADLCTARQLPAGAGAVGREQMSAPW